MSQSFIRNLSLCATFVLPAFLLSVQPTLASESKGVNNTLTTQQQSIFTNSLRIDVSKPSKYQDNTSCVNEGTNTSCQTILKTKPQGSQRTTPTNVKPTNNNLVQPLAGRRGNVFFNLINLTSVRLIGLFIRPSGSDQVVEVNLVGGDLIPGETQRITIRYNTCFYDIGFAFADGENIVRNNANLCSIGNYYLRE